MNKLLLLFMLCLLLPISCGKDEVTPTYLSSRNPVSIPSRYLPNLPIRNILFGSLWVESYGNSYVQFAPSGRVTEYTYDPANCSYSLSDLDSIAFVSEDTIRYYSDAMSSSYSEYSVVASNDTLKFLYSYNYVQRVFIRTPFLDMDDKKNACLARFAPVNLDTLVNHLWYYGYYGRYVSFRKTGLMTSYTFNTSTCGYSVYDTDSLVFSTSDSVRYYSSPGYGGYYNTYLIRYVGDSLILSRYGYSEMIYTRTTFDSISQKSSSCVASLVPDAFEPDNLYSQADTILIGSTTPDHTIYPSGDKDYFKFTVSTPGYYTLQTNGNMDTYMTLYNSTGTSALINNDDDGLGSNALIRYNFSSIGTYYVAITGYSGSGNAPYSLTIENY